MDGTGDVTTLIERARSGEAGALDELFARLYPELRRAAHGQRGRSGIHDPLLSTTALVNEAYLKLRGSERIAARDRGHFLAYAATAMRSIIIDAARARLAERRGGADQQRVTLDSTLADELPQDDEELLDIDAALTSLAAIDRRLAQVVEMRWFGGLSEAEVGEALSISERTVRRDWEKARLLLAAALRG